ncbi:MAG: hypothetical protein GY797_38945 [Deltaproteobacteria bacterium]|nr:hypothetical protein [Deltaproteobacteria bacterium]
MKKLPIKKKTQRKIKPEELKKIRKFFHKKLNKGICPVLKMRFDVAEMVVDHAHTANSKNLRKPEEAGLIRGVIHRQANTMEGKITNSFIRCGLHKFDITLPEFLRQLADFIDDPPMIRLNYLHPTEKKAKSKNLKKNSIKKLRKMFHDRYPNRKIPEVLIFKRKKTKRGKMKDREKKLTAGLEKLYKEFRLTPEFKKG